MKSVVYCGDSKVALANVPRPRVRPGWALIRVMAAGICGSDLRMYRTSATELGSRVGQCAGHEAAGIVEEVGPDASVKPGDRVLIYHFYGCGHCRYCLSGNIQLCPKSVGMSAAGCGSSAEYVLAPEINCVRLHDELSFAEGALMACCAATSYSGLKKIGIAGDATLTIFGMGPVGLCALLMAKAMGYRVIAVEVSPQRLSLARSFGADEVIDASQADDVIPTIKDMTFGHGAECSLETSGAASARVQALESLAPQGKLILIGLGKHGAPSLEAYDIILGEKTVAGSYVLPMGMYEPLSDFLVQRKVGLERIVTHKFTFDEAQTAFSTADGLAAGKVIFEIPS